MNVLHGLPDWLLMIVVEGKSRARRSLQFLINNTLPPTLFAVERLLVLALTEGGSQRCQYVACVKSGVVVLIWPSWLFYISKNARLYWSPVQLKMASIQQILHMSYRL